MKEIIVKAQAEFDALPLKFEEYTKIIIENDTSVGKINVAVARGNSSVVARGNSSVVARENSSVVAWENSGVHLQSDLASVILFMFSACWVLAKGKVQKKSKNATVIKPKKVAGTNGWLESQGVKKEKRYVLLSKHISSDWKTQENTPNETVWSIGTTLTNSNWLPKNSECGEGKFHACSKPYFCNEFRSTAGDKYIAIKVNVKDLYSWPNPQYPHKIAFRKGTVIYQCDKFGKKI